MNPTRLYLAISTAIFTLALMAWAVVEIINNGGTPWTSAILVYLALVRKVKKTTYFLYIYNYFYKQET